MMRGFFGNKTYELSLVENYVQHWGLGEAVRELIQNALDSTSPFVYSFQMGADGRYSLRLFSEFSTLLPSTLLLGSSSKQDDSGAIGSFGEGYKIAMLVLTRLKYDVNIFNGDLWWKPEFRLNDKYGERLLCIVEDRMPRKNTGLTFEVHNLSEEDVSTIKASCLRMQDNIGAIKQTSKGDILMERPGELFVGSLFICKTDMKYGYNLKPEFVKLERDRQTVSNFDLKWTTRDMWFETNEFELIANLIEEGVTDLECAKYDSPALVKEACYRRFREQHPGAVVASSQKELDELVSRGMTVVITNDVYHSVITSSTAYREENKLQFYKQSAAEYLREWLKLNRSEMRAKAIESFKKDVLSTAENWKV
jgi:hypothetical protein